MKRLLLIGLAVLAVGCNGGDGGTTSATVPDATTATDTTTTDTTTTDPVILSRVAAVQLRIDNTLAADLPVELTEDLLTGLPAEDVIHFINEYITNDDTGDTLVAGTHIRPIAGLIDGRRYTT